MRAPQASPWRQNRRPCWHAIGGNTHGEACVSTEMLVGEKQHSTVRSCPLKGPIQHAFCVRRRAHHAAMATNKVLQVGARIHVGDGHKVSFVFTCRLLGMFSGDGVCETGFFEQFIPRTSTSLKVAISAMEHPARRLGKITLWSSEVRISADSAMK